MRSQILHNRVIYVTVVYSSNLFCAHILHLAALDRDANKAAVGQQQSRLPEVSSKYKPQHNPNKGVHGGANNPSARGGVDMAEVMDRLNQFSYYMQSNDVRMRQLESAVSSIDNVSYSVNVQGKLLICLANLLSEIFHSIIMSICF